MNDSKIKEFLSEPLPSDVKRVIERIARIEDVRHVAVLPDVHLAEKVCVGLAVATKNVIFPEAVGGDIGCGMATVAINIYRESISESEANAILRELTTHVPIFRHHSKVLSDELQAMPLSAHAIEVLRDRDGRVQSATLGRGNHFLEIQSDQENQIWILVHSGSRAMGPAIRDWHLSRAAGRHSGLAYLEADSEIGRAYLADVAFARRYASLSRSEMLAAAGTIICEFLGGKLEWDTQIESDHNHVQLEPHFGEDFWVHRKGATSAKTDEPGILPGSMATTTYHTLGRGCEDSLHSGAHGAGRAISRTDAKRLISRKDLENQTREIWWDHQADLREEAPHAYKDIRKVLRAQRDLVKVVRTLKPLLSYRGSE